jgi:hypothetical protein
VKTLENQPDYEILRNWALHPSANRPPGLAQILRAGMITWLQTVQSLSAAPLREIGITQTLSGVTTPLSTLVAAMIAEVFS